jgi:Tol biopolymer transport system component
VLIIVTERSVGTKWYVVRLCIVFYFFFASFFPGAAFHSFGEELYFLSKRGRYYGVYVQNLRSTRCIFDSAELLKQFPDRASYHVTFDVSSDGRFFTYSAMSETGSMDIFLTDLSCFHTINLTRDSLVDSMPRFSHDGKWIAYLSHAPGERMRDDLFLISRDDGRGGNARKQLTFGMYRVLSFCFSPDDRDILFVKYFNSRSTVITRVEIAGRRLWELTSPACSSRSPSFSGQGGRIVYSSDCDGNFDLWIMNRDGRGSERLYGSSGYESEPVFSSDGSQVLFFSDFSQTEGRVIEGTVIYAIRIDGTGLTNLTPELFMKRAYVFSQLQYEGGKGVYYFQGKMRGSRRKSYYEVYTLNPERKEMKKVSRGYFDKMNPLLRTAIRRISTTPFSAGRLQ